jgi:tripartite-type tricarboxylate transporter receptor subunit TctC
VLGVSSTERLNSAAGADPKGAGIDFVRFGWLGICAGAGTPQPIVDLLNRHIATVVASPGIRPTSARDRSGIVPPAGCGR